VRLRTPSPPPDLARPLPDQPPAALDLAAARRRERWRTRLRRGGAVAALVAVLATATWVVGYSDLLVLDRVEVEGAGDGLSRAVVRAAQAPVGVPLARVDLAAVADRVAEVPEVEDVVAVRAWPDVLRLDVTPRTPLAVIDLGGRWQFLDDEGVLFGTARGPREDLPVVLAPSTGDTEPVRSAAVAVAGALPPGLLARVQRVEAASPVDVRLLLRDGRRVAWGSAEESERKAEVLAALLRTPATSYDVSVPDRPTLRPAP
jgi:cell division protein FtsQ